MRKFCIFFTLLLICLNQVKVNGFTVKLLNRGVNSVPSASPKLSDTTVHTTRAPTTETSEDTAKATTTEPNTKWKAPIAADTVVTEAPTSGLLKQCDPCLEDIVCVPQIQCPAHVRMTANEKPKICDLPGGGYGFCCVTGQNHTVIRRNVERTPFVGDLPMHIAENARKSFKQLTHKVPKVSVRRGHPEFLHGMVFHSSRKEDKQHFHSTNMAMQQIIAGQMFSKSEQIPLDDIITNNLHVEFTKTPLAHHCAAPRPCAQVNSRYRSYDGLCNNPLPQCKFWGAAGSPMERLLPPAYEDGMWMPRMHSVDGSWLMGARETSRRLFPDGNRQHPKYNLLLMQFGQFLAHDFSQTSSVRLESGDHVQCCSTDGTAALPVDKRHFACLPIPVEEDDDFFSQFEVRCLNFVRLSLVPNADCKMGYGKQRSKVTHFLDASTVYGSSTEASHALRTFHGGKLQMFRDFGRDLLPLTDEKTVCDSEEPGKTCFRSGDGRTNQIISLIVLHIIFAREHNRIAGILAQLNPNCSDERLFQEARRIVIAEMQHITYNEYLPAIIGPLQMKRFRLVPQSRGYAEGYSIHVNPAITNEFSGAAFRMGHSSVDGKFHIHSAGSQVDEVINIPDVMFNPSRMRKRSFYDDLLRTMIRQPMQQVDGLITQGLSHFLFRGHHPFGLDLAAFNIQRGRDQGLRSYNDYLEVMGLRRIRNFNQLPPEVGRRLSTVYHHPDDIDLWVGGLLERPVPDGIVGQTFAEIIADQFSRFKYGDRYFYEYGKHINPGAFTGEQLHEIRKVTMARLICDNADHVLEVPPSAFVRVDFPHNEPVRCDSSKIPFMDLAAWRT